MTWHRFKILTLQLNGVVLCLGWLSFWSYGVFVEDIPPLSVVPALLAVSALVVVALSAVLFIGVHMYLSLLQGRSQGEALSKATRLAPIGLVLAALCSTLASGNIDFPVLIEEGLFLLALGLGLPSLLWLLYGVPVEVAPRVFKWQFD